MLSKNMSGYDRIFRILIALFLITFAITGRIGAWGWVIGAVLLATAAVSRCPLYGLLGFRPRRSTD